MNDDRRLWRAGTLFGLNGSITFFSQDADARREVDPAPIGRSRTEGQARVMAARKRAVLIAIGFALAPSNAGAQDIYRGILDCEPIPGLAHGRLSVPFTVLVDGQRLTYSRQMLDQGSAPRLLEQGAGTIAGRQVSLAGSAAGRDWHYSASYRGEWHVGQITLEGEQIWKGTMIGGTFHRSCTAILVNCASNPPSRRDALHVGHTIAMRTQSGRRSAATASSDPIPHNKTTG